LTLSSEQILERQVFVEIRRDRQTVQGAGNDGGGALETLSSVDLGEPDRLRLGSLDAAAGRREEPQGCQVLLDHHVAPGGWRLFNRRHRQRASPINIVGHHLFVVKNVWHDSAREPSQGPRRQ